MPVESCNWSHDPVAVAELPPVMFVVVYVPVPVAFHRSVGTAFTLLNAFQGSYPPNVSLAVAVYVIVDMV